MSICSLSASDSSNPKCANSDTSAAALSRGHALATLHDKSHVVDLVIHIEKLFRPCMSCHVSQS